MVKVVDIRFETGRVPIEPLKAELDQLVSDSRLLFGPGAQQVIDQEAQQGGESDASH